MKHKFLIFGGLAIALVSPASAKETEPLGRLFFSPVERAKLDEARRAPPASVSPPKQTIQAIAKPRAPLSRPDTITLNGIVRRSDGQSTVWVNNRPISDQDESAIAIKSPDEGGRIALQLPESKRNLRLKVGERADVRTGEISER